MRITRQIAARETKTITCKVEINKSDVCKVLREYYDWYQTEGMPDYRCYISKGSAKRLFAERFPDFQRSIVNFSEWCVWLALQEGFLTDPKSDMSLTYEIPPTILATRSGKTSKKVLEHIKHMQEADEDDYDE